MIKEHRDYTPPCSARSAARWNLFALTIWIAALIFSALGLLAAAALVIRAVLSLVR